MGKAAEEAGEGMVLRPVSVDREALSDKSDDFQMGEDIDGLGGFVLESADGSVLMDYRFEGRLRDAWDASLGEVSSILFGE